MRFVSLPAVFFLFHLPFGKWENTKRIRSQRANHEQWRSVNSEQNGFYDALMYHLSPKRLLRYVVQFVMGFHSHCDLNLNVQSKMQIKRLNLNKKTFMDLKIMRGRNGQKLLSEVHAASFFPFFRLISASIIEFHQSYIR